MAGVKSQAPYFHRVQRIARSPQLPKSQWKGQTFIEPDGTELVVSWNGDVNCPRIITKPWQTKPCSEPTRLALPSLQRER